MTSDDRDALETYIRWVANEMELRDWTIHFEDAPPPGDDADGWCVVTYGRKLSTIRVAAEFRGYDADRQRHIVVHELVHCHVEPAANMVRGDLEGVLGAQADALFWAAFRRQMEYTVDGLASAIAKHLPHITWPEAARS